MQLNLEVLGNIIIKSGRGQVFIQTSPHQIAHEHYLIKSLLFKDLAAIYYSF
ncbi:hypothetical protein COO91_07659 [Nostoc flagelliforme CCNUN1]|uniref:Uncharacterized protein n=1 Tax=Nostoc flagelliforme CCNUN1 TaxID=2038116 RepID=A0A2K8T1R9_9NOSO|nr:hypothetical protein COO91_07659 [Nostoc flagelliforme CCNUN1]